MCSIGALVAASVAPAHAQFTTAVIPPRRPQPPAVQATVAGDRARDTAIVARLTDMKAWVDSAAGALAVRPPTDSAYVDTAAVPDRLPVADTSAREAVGEVESRRARRGAERRFTDGGRAPDTATPMALLALLGAGSLVAGLALRRR